MVSGESPERLVDLDDLARQGRDHVRDGLDRLDLGVGLVGLELGADRRGVEEDDLAQRVLRVPGDPEGGLAVLDARPVVLGW